MPNGLILRNPDSKRFFFFGVIIVLRKQLVDKEGYFLWSELETIQLISHFERNLIHVEEGFEAGESHIDRWYDITSELADGKDGRNSYIPPNAPIPFSSLDSETFITMAFPIYLPQEFEKVRSYYELMLPFAKVYHEIAKIIPQRVLRGRSEFQAMEQLATGQS